MTQILSRTVVLTVAVLLLLLNVGIAIGSKDIETSTSDSKIRLDGKDFEYEINFHVISNGGTMGNSEQFILRGTKTQSAISEGNSESYALHHGFWQGFCNPGDADFSGGVDIDDVVYLIQYIFGGGAPPAPMICCADANASCNTDIDDVVYLIEYIFGGGPAPAPSYYICGLF